ncbi:MAG: T9SS type A sorting domain-containing protein [Bacteroidales bacterium]|nr:T9SS type A sorting domain-containing protein [Bacteroidales bacterium]
MKRNKLPIILLIILISFNLQAQVFEQIHSEDKYKINSVIDDGISKSLDVVENYDDNGLYINLTSSTSYGYSAQYILLDDDINVIREDNELDSVYSIKYRVDNKLYKIGGTLIGDYTFGYIDNLRIVRLNSNGVLISTDTIMKASEDTINWNASSLNTLMLEDRSIIIMLSAQIHDFITPARAAKLIRIDTLGNVLSSKIFYKENDELDICEMKDNIMFAISGAPPIEYINDQNYIYYLNKETLEIEDSIMGYKPANMTSINDTILAFTYQFAKYVPEDSVKCINLINTKTKRLTNVNLESPNPDISDISFDFYNPNRSRFIDCVNPDSVYICYYMRDWDYSYTTIDICNFNLNGDTNCTLSIKYDTTGFKQIQGIKATKDGGLIIAAYSSNDGDSGSDIWLIKYHPKGLIGLTNIETGEKETIKVYPNPAKDFVYVDIDATNFDKGEIDLFDMQGKLVKRAKLSAKQGNRVDVSNLNAGAYTYNVSLNGKTISGKVIVGE